MNSDELSAEEEARLQQLVKNNRAIAVLNCETYELWIDEITEGHIGMRVQGIDGRMYYGSMLPHHAKQLRDLLVERLP